MCKMDFDDNFFLARPMAVRSRRDQTERDQTSKTPNGGIVKDLHDPNDQRRQYQLRWRNQAGSCQTKHPIAPCNQICQISPVFDPPFESPFEPRWWSFWPNVWRSPSRRSVHQIHADLHVKLTDLPPSPPTPSVGELGKRIRWNDDDSRRSDACLWPKTIFL